MKKRYTLCEKCKYYTPTYNHYPCTKCDGKEVPLTCEACRYYPCKNPHQLKPCKNFMWD